MRASMRRVCSSGLTSSQYFEKDDAGFDDRLLDEGNDFQEALDLLLVAEVHDAFDAGTIVPAAVEDHDLAGRRKVRQIALDIHLRPLAIASAAAGR